ncbi:hypothetical protein AQUCO_00300618v1 [Aquilegia coerulea]|uniref:Drought induced 19 protein type zinc-binding domain-containing protein n=1 Tax=Aquilegia coerulea TaxID=218851 RepID=A0A2G5EZQ4_AQUCA|nr:hypothetical protein AQUCO_00300618v1 [Aquilegia coerulea]
MENDSWTTAGRLSNSTSSRRFQSTIQSRSDLYLGFEEIDVDDESRVEFPCPFCTEDFDIIGLCCHIDDEHPVEAKNGVCPVCGMRVGTDMVGHIAMQHGQFFKMQRKKRFRKGGSQSNLSLLRKELRDGNLQALLGGSGSVVSSSNAAPDPLLSSFMYNLPMFEEPKSVQPCASAEASSIKKSEERVLERSVQPSPLSDKDQEERASRCEFVQGMVLSTMFDDIL